MADARGSDDDELMNEINNLIQRLDTNNKQIRDKLSNRFPMVITLDTLLQRQREILVRLREIVESENIPDEIKSMLEELIEDEIRDVLALLGIEPPEEEEEEEEEEEDFISVEDVDDEEEGEEVMFHQQDDEEQDGDDETVSIEDPESEDIRGFGLMASYSHRIQMALSQARSRAS
jgi:flagellar hook-associated protein FlgK